MNDNNEICCPRFNPEPWHNVIVEWHEKKFIKDKVLTFFYMPLNFGSVMKRLDKKVKDAGASIPDWLCLSDHTSKWNMDIYLAVDQKIQDCNNGVMNGKYFCLVYEGPYSDTAKWCKDFETKARSKKLTIKKQYMWYTTCPKCAKKYGKNYVTIIGQIE